MSESERDDGENASQSASQAWDDSVSMQSDNSKGYPLNLKKDATQQSVMKKRPVSPAFSAISMESDNSKGYPLNFSDDATQESVMKKRPVSPAFSAISMKSDNSKGYPPNFSDDATQERMIKQRPVSPTPSGISMKSDNSKGYPLNFRGDVTQERHDSDHVEVPDNQRTITDNEHLVDYLKKCTMDGRIQQANPTCLNEVFTELHIIEGGGKDVNCEHEVIQTERLYRRTAKPDTTIICNDIFKPQPGQQKQIRTVLTNGIAGIGKTFTVQKVVLDWAEKKAYKDIHSIILLSFRELNLIKDRLLSLTELLEYCSKRDIDILDFFNYNVMLILDGLDESRIPLDFLNNEKCCDVTQHTSVSVLLASLIRGDLLQSARIWITTRPAAASQIPSQFIDQVTEIRGFTDLQKDEYFMKRVSNESTAARTVSHLKSSRSLYIMCHIPVFCWIAATVLEELFSETHKGELPKTLTQMYTCFLITQTNIKKKYTEKKETDAEIILKLGKLAFQQLEKGNLIFYAEDLKECGIDVKEALVYSGVCTQIFKDDSGLCKEKVFCFVHLTVQEYLAALYAHMSFVKDDVSVFGTEQTSSRARGLTRLHKEAVDRAVMSPNGHLDLFLRFLLGLSQESNQKLLNPLLPQMGKTTRKDDTVKYIIQKIKENPLPEKSINLFHCLNELNYQDLVEEVKNYLCSKLISKIKLSNHQWAALVFILLTSEKDVDIFDLSQYMESNEAFQMLLPVVRVAKTVMIRKCNLTEKSCEMLADILKSSTLQELDLSGSHLQLRQMKLLGLALGTVECKLKKLKLNGCQLNDDSCAEVVSAFSSNSASLRELDMTNNQLCDSVLKNLSETLKTQKWQLKVLRLRQCGVKPGGFRDLTSALQANPSHLKELDLSMNISGDDEVQALCEALNQPECRLQILKLNKCELTHVCCSSLASIMSSESSSLLELHLSDNNIQDAGVEKLAAGLKKAHCKLKVLKLNNCNISVKGYGYLASALRLNPSHLRELYVKWNHSENSGTNPLTDLLDTRPQGLKLEMDKSLQLLFSR